MFRNRKVGALNNRVDVNKSKVDALNDRRNV